MTAADTTRLAGDAYSTRLACGVSSAPDDKTRLAQQGYQSKLAREAVGVPPDANELYKVGEKIGGRYEVSAIHHGAMGVVYGCFDHQTKLPRALKTVRTRYLYDMRVVAMFEGEATVWVTLEKHPYIVRAYVVERFNNRPYVVTEYVRGPEGMEGDMRGWLGHPRLTLPVAVTMALQIAQGMQHAVRKVPNLVHRDLKPANILVNGDGKAMVTDFGLVRAAEAGAGTPAYMSPEQWREDVIDVRSDIYAYGCILFEMFTAHRLFPSATEQEWKSAHIANPPVALSSLNSVIPTEVDRFVRLCLEKDKSSRPQNWNEIVAFFAEWNHRLTGNAVVLDFSSLALDTMEWITTGYSFHNLKKFDEALSAFERAIELDAKNAATWFMKGHTLSDLKRHGEALTAFDQAITLDPKDKLSWFMKGVALANLKHYGEAVAAYDQSIILDPNKTLLQHRGCTPQQCRDFAQQLESLSEGAIVKGVVQNIMAFGAFVFIGGIDGVLHISDMTWRRLRHPSEVLNVGDIVTAKVLKIDIEKNRISLGLKQLGEDPWVGSAHRYEAGTRLLGTVISISDNGLWVEIEPGIEGFVHRSDMSLPNEDDHPSSVVQVDDQVEVMIMQIDEKHRRLSLGMKQCTPNPQDIFVREIQMGDELADEKRYEDAIQAYDRALVLNPDDAHAWQKKGNALLRLERYDAALSAFERASPLDTRGGVSFIKGFTLQKLKRYEESISACDRALAINPTLEIAQSTRSFSLQELKRHDAASQVRRPESLWTKLWKK